MRKEMNEILSSSPIAASLSFTDNNLMIKIPYNN